MAQLIKLKDYISRYEIDFYRYPGQFIRLKQEKWNKLVELWKGEGEQVNTTSAEQEPPPKKNWFQKMVSNWHDREQSLDFFKKEERERETTLPSSMQELKQYYLDRLLPTQIKWATSTIHEASFMEPGLEYHPQLKYFIQRFPDTFFIMFQPIFLIKQAEIEAETIMITPLEVLCISIVEKAPEYQIEAQAERTWILHRNEEKTKMLSPLVSLKRTENIVKSILHANEIDMPVNKVVLSRSNEIMRKNEPYQTEIVDKTAYHDWFEKMRAYQSPLKHTQLRAGEALLKHCQTTSVKRPEWEEEDIDSQEFHL
ncbi:NERD domain-containing protein [Salirhabdus salicampi]|uniref:NERD domain-containing protein n=1 Tax=Salirhabdus salicampi TaxID=476102 RepID=UPI0020C2E1F1|nr:NERD domain-containing protein [Salirhabdus salicampi]MCP8617163.1 NERD domain-containing protein [Salirhabdus salicampi]